MSARVSSPSPRRFNAWCDDCTDGINTNSKLKADTWAYDHNVKNHLSNRMSHHETTVYTKSKCPGCTRTKTELALRGVTFTEIDMEKDPAALAYVLSLGHQQAPVVVLADGTSWSGLVPPLINQHFGKRPTNV